MKALQAGEGFKLCRKQGYLNEEQFIHLEVTHLEQHKQNWILEWWLK